MSYALNMKLGYFAIIVCYVSCKLFKSSSVLCHVIFGGGLKQMNRIYEFVGILT